MALSSDSSNWQHLLLPRRAEENKKDTQIPVFKKWKGTTEQDMLTAMWKVSGGNKDFILTMAAENGSFNPYLKHPHKNKDGSWDYSFGLNSYYHKSVINKILAKEMSLEEIAKYHLDIYNKPDWKTSCGKKAFCGYNRRNNTNIKNLIIFPK